jgi:hypothetical protein
MPQVTETFFVGCPISIEVEMIPRPAASPEEIELNGQALDDWDPDFPPMIKVWKLVVFDPQAQTRFCYRMDQEQRDQLVKDLLGGIELASRTDVLRA